ncbi:MAG TPA: hypothetical protein VH478_01225 [Trebonia sp.]|nr:hypothetical protein [Trebonia sp.]
MLDRITLITGNAGKAAEYAAMLGTDVTPPRPTSPRSSPSASRK